MTHKPEGRAFSAAEIDRMTTTEVALALDDDLQKRRAPAGSEDVSKFGGPAGYVKWWRSLTPAERLARAREKWVRA